MSVTSSTICTGQTTTLTAIGASSYSWFIGAQPLNSFSSTIAVSPTLTSTYVVVGSTGVAPNNCILSNSITIVVGNSANVVIGPDVTICEGQSASIYATGGTTYSWSPSFNITNVNDASVIVTPNTTTIYSVIVTYNNSCSGTGTVNVIVNPLPYVYAGADTTTNIDNAITLFGAGNVQVGFINPTSGVSLSCNYCSIITVNPLQNTCYTLEGINQFGCKNTDDVCIKVLNDWDVFIPNAFTPNGDKKNEIFIPLGYGIEEIKLTIFDRWGKQIYTSDDKNIGWNGESKGQLCEQGVYIYQAEIKTMSGTKFKKTGHVSLLARFE